MARVSLLILSVAFVWSLTGIAGQAQNTEPAQLAAVSASELASEQATFEVMCGICHSSDLVAGVSRTPTEFAEMITKMQSYGATGTPEEFATTRTFMLRFWGKVNVNTDSAADLAPVLDVSREVAQSVVDRRMQRGKFASLEDLKTVAGVDAARLDGLKDRLTF